MVIDENAPQGSEPAEVLFGPRSVLLRCVSFVYALCGVFYAFIYLAALECYTAAWILVGGVAMLLATPLVYRLSRSTRVAANFLLCVLFVVLTYLVFITGGLVSPSLTWLILIPMTAVLFVDLRNVLLWLAVIVLEVTLIGTTEALGFQYIQAISSPGLIILDVLAIAGLAGVATGCVYVYRRQFLKMNGQLRYEALHDGLTGLLNHQAIIGRVEELAARLEPAEKLALIMADLDFFKAVNDRCGHTAGDRVLRETAARIRRCLRAADAIGRFGGEEFLCALPNCPDDVALALAENIRSAMQREPFDVESSKVSVTISLGVASFDPRRDADPRNLIRRADAALYEAKRAGRNCVRTAAGMQQTRAAAKRLPIPATTTPAAGALLPDGPPVG